MRVKIYGLAVLTFFTLMLGMVVWHAAPVSEPVVVTTPVILVDDSGDAGRPPVNPESGIKIRVTEGALPSEAAEVNPQPVANWLPGAETQQILSRLPRLGTTDQDKVRFAMRGSTLAAPRTGAIVHQAFPPPATPTPVMPGSQGPLEVLRQAPEGHVHLVPQISVTFSQPMVPLTSLGDLEAREVPVQLTPQPPGHWHWLGTRTLVFEGTPRFPMATSYQVSIKPGVTSVVKGKLNSGVTWQFDTPPPTVQQSYPGGTAQPLDPHFFVSFDQDVDAQAVMATTRLVSHGQNVPIAMMADSEIAQDAELKLLVANAIKNRWIAFQATQKLQPGTTYTVQIGPGTPSLEGPRRTEQVQSFSIHTYDPLSIVGYSGDNYPVPPLQSWSINFNNPLEVKAFQKSMVQVTPELPGLRVHARGNSIVIDGQSRGKTTYRVTIAAGLLDTYGQTLGHEAAVSIKTGTLPASLQGPGSPMLVVNPKGKPTWSVFSVNHPDLRVRMCRVTPDDFPAWQKYLSSWRDERNAPPLPGQVVVDRTVHVQAESDQMAEVPLDLSEALNHGLGQVVVVVEPSVQPTERWQWQAAMTWVQVTHIGLDAMVDGDHLLGWATSLADGQPMAGVSLSIWPQHVSGTTGAEGTASLDLPVQGTNQINLLVARQGDDLALLPEQTYWYYGGGSWVKQPRPDSLAWFVFDDRGMYRPKEEVHLKGWLRRLSTTDVSLADVKALPWHLFDSRGNEVGKGTVEVGPLGGFEMHFTLPDRMNLGSARVQFDNGFTHSFDVQEFRRPEFEVSAEAGEGPFFLGETASASVHASYYAGGALPGAPVTWSVTASPGLYSPPGHEDFTFGTWTPWWEAPEVNVYGQSDHASLAGHTDGNGRHSIRIEVLKDVPARPVSIRATANVQDVNRQQWGSTAAVLVHPSKLYVGLRSARLFVQQGEPLAVQAIACDIDGKMQNGRAIALRLVRREWQEDDSGDWHMVEVDPQQVELTSKTSPVDATFKTPKGGLYSLKAVVEDEQGRPNETELTLWVAGRGLQQPHTVQQQKVTLIPDRKTYEPGQTAEVLVNAPFAPAEGLMTLRRAGLVRTQHLHLDKPFTTLKVPIEEAWMPDVTVQVDLNGQVDGKPAYAEGVLTLSISTQSRRLTVQAEAAPAKVEPGGKTTVHLSVHDANGQPVANSEVAVVVVDEAILALSNYHMGDPMTAFYPSRGAGVRDYHSRAQVVLQEDALKKDKALRDGLPEYESTRGLVSGGAPSLAAPAPASAPMEEAKAQNMAAAPPPPPAGPKFMVRTNLNPLALFEGHAHTDASGKAEIPVKLPDNLTRYRIMVVAISGPRQFGQGEGSLVARLPLMVRPSAPRFLNFGDVFELPVVLQNQTDKPMKVKVVVRGSNVHLTQGQGKVLEVAANDRAEVRFPAEAVEAGTARFQVAAVAGPWTDAQEISLPVWTPATTEAFATYGVIDNGAMAQPVQPPSNVFTQFGGLEVTTSSTAVASLTDAFFYIQSYPYECAEQISSRVMAVAALRDVLSAFKAEGLPPEKEILAAMNRDIAKLAGMQNYDGGFGFWYSGSETWPFISIHVAHALQRAKEKGFKVPDDVMERCVEYLTNIDSHIPAWYGESEKRALRAYAVYVLNRMGKPDPSRARAIIADGGLQTLSLEAVGWLMPLLPHDPDIHRLLMNRVRETAADANFTTSYDDGEHLLLASDRRVDAVLLEALIGDEPKSDLIPKLVNGLLDHRVQGRWESTQENCWVLLALDRYFNTYEKVTPDFVSRVWLGDQYAGDHTFKGHTTERSEIDVPMGWLKKPADLVISKEGPGRLYYRLGMRYAPQNLNLPAADYGYSVQRVYEAVDHPGDVHRDANGVWHVKAGAEVRVKLT
ncbi:MAG: Ig-like domain-containing protein, partial [Candidatus Xenobia bacterium]